MSCLDCQLDYIALIDIVSVLHVEFFNIINYYLNQN